MKKISNEIKRMYEVKFVSLLACNDKTYCLLNLLVQQCTVIKIASGSMHHCDVLCLVLSMCSLPAYHYAEHLGSSKMPLVCAPCLLSVVAATVPGCLCALYSCMVEIPTSCWFDLKSFYWLVWALSIIGASLSEPHIDHDNVPRRGEIYVCGRV